MTANTLEVVHVCCSVAAIPSLVTEEIVAEKIRAASQRSKIRDLHDLAEVSKRPLNRDLIRTLAVLKLWNTGGPGLDFERFRQRADAGLADGVQEAEDQPVLASQRAGRGARRAGPGAAV